MLYVRDVCRTRGCPRSPPHPSWHRTTRSPSARPCTAARPAPATAPPGARLALLRLAAGLGFLKSLWTKLSPLRVGGAPGGIFLMANHTLASAGIPFDPQGFHLLLIACLVVFLAARGGGRGLDG